MSSLDFPLNPVDSQEYSLNGVTYYYNAALGAWLTKSSTVPTSTSVNKQVTFNDGGFSNGSYGLVFDKSANTLFANTINVSSNMRVFGNLQIGTGTVTITNNSISAASIIVDGSAIPSGAAANLAFDTANAAYAAANNVGPQIAPAFNTANLAFNAANNVGPQIAPAFNTANAAFGKANTALQNTSGTFAGNLSVSGNLDLSLSSSALKIPVGTTAQRPIGAAGMIRFNSTTGQPEWYDNNASAWAGLYQGASYSIEVLIVAGGGGGGMHSGGGGGAGGLLYYGSETPKTPNGSALSISGGSAYAVVIGAGGAGAPGTYPSPNSARGNNGSDSSFGTNNAIGGGGGGGVDYDGASGGSGGGGSRSRAGGSGTSGQGNAGGYWGSANPNYPGGGGGGAGGVGGNGDANYGGNGGAGLAYSIDGSSKYYAGGGGGNIQSGTAAGSGGSSVGGAGATNGGLGANAVVNRGSGGGGSQYNGGTGSGSNYGNGSSGVVIIRYLGSQRGSGGTVTSSGGYTIHTFTSSGTFIA